jgi:hypothetical protein
VLKRPLKSRLPSRESIHRHPWLQPFTHWLVHPNLWHLHRRSVAGGVAVGLFCGLIPGPLQMLGAVLLAILFRVNLPVALFFTLYTNPFTILPLYLLAYQLGAWVSGAETDTAGLVLPELHWHDWFWPLIQWVSSLGHAFAIGLPLLALSLAVSGYVAVRMGWHGWILWRLRQRRRSRTRRIPEHMEL